MTHPSLEQLASWTLGESGSEQDEALEEHLFACERCTAEAERMTALVRALKDMLPPVLDHERLRRVEASAPPFPRTRVDAGGEGLLAFGPEDTMGLWLLQANLTGVVRLDVELASREGANVATFADVPFDAERGEILLACQSHYDRMGLPADIVARVTAVDVGGSRPVASYRLNHSFPRP